MKRLYRRISIYLKKIMPKQILWRTFFILIAPIIILQIVVGTVFYRQYINDEINASIERSLSHIEFIKQQKRTPPEFKDFLKNFSKYNLGYFKLLKKESRITNNCSVHGIMLLVQKKFEDQEHFFDICRIKNKNRYRIYVPFDEEYYLRITYSPRHFFSSQWHFLPVWSLGASFLLIAIAFLFLKNQMRPIMRLGEAAKAFGKGHSDFPLHSSGAIEIRQASIAFIEMRKKISDHLKNRSLLLAGISHDLRTFITRLSLELSLMEKSPEVIAMQNDVKRMENILQSYIDFVSHNNNQSYILSDPIKIIDGLIARTNSRTNKIEFTYDGPKEIWLKDQSLDRIILNLLSNGLKYGDYIIIKAVYYNHTLKVTFEDNGIGVPEEHLKNIFEPFFSVRSERTQNNTSGSGLGLALIKDIIIAHGGIIYAERSETLRGLKVSFTLASPQNMNS